MTTGEILLFKTIFEQTPVSTQIFTPDGETLMVNSAWEKLWNVPFEKIKSYNILKDQQLVETGIMPLIKRAFKGESVELPTIKYDPSRTVKVKGVVPYRILGADMYPIRGVKGDITHIVLQHEDITQRVEAEEMKHQLAAIVESTDDPIISKNLDGIITSWNKGAQKLYGYTEKQAIGKHISLIIPPELQKEEEKILSKIRHGIPISVFETVRIGKSGKRINMSVRISPLRDAQGKVIGVSKIARDITEEKASKEGLRKNEELFRVLTSHAPVGIFLTDKDGNCLFVNKKWCELAGMTLKQAMGAGWANALHPDDRERVFAEWYTAAKKGKEFKLEYRFLTPKGKVTWLSGSSVPLLDDKKRVTGYMGTITDITYRKKAEESIRESEERLRIAVEAGNIGVWDWNVKENILNWSDNVYKIHGVPKRFPVTVETFASLIHPDDKGRIMVSINKSVSGEAPFTAEFRIIRPNGEVRWITTSAYNSFDAKGKAERMLGATMDITEQKVLEQEKSDFLSMASHELKTPLTSLKIFIDLLQSQLEKNGTEKGHYYLNRINEQSNRLAELTNDLLDVSRIETGKLKLKKEKFRLDELVFDTVESIQPVPNNQRIVVRGSDQVLISADRYRLYQVLINLLTNALKYSPRDKQVVVSLKKQKGTVMIQVRDYGIGIKKDKQQRIFEKLYQVSDPQEKTYPGLGLGLYIAREIIERHQGRIWVESEGKGKGSTFFVSLPRMQN